MKSYNGMKKKIKKRNIKIVIIFIAIAILSIVGVVSIILYNSIYQGCFDNSVYYNGFYNSKKVLVLVPHQDDEINVAGATIKNYIENDSEVIVAFTTNGDYSGLGEVRINEAINTMQKLGVKKENVIFLGYGDQWSTEYKHIYHSPEDEVVESNIGYVETYGSSTIDEFRMNLLGEHAEYTRNNFKSDIKELIITVLPDNIFVVDFDHHIDHRATSLIFEEVMGELLAEKSDYTPNVYKGFAYSTAWYAEKDFYGANLESTIKPSISELISEEYELDIPNYNWDNRIRFLVPNSTLTYTKRSNVIYKALKEYKSQKAQEYAEQVINSDQVFWERSTKSITYTAVVETTSGDGSCLNDFKLVDSSDISERHTIFDKGIWIPDEDDNEKKVIIRFNEVVNINSVSLYENHCLESNITKGKLTFSDGSEIEVENLNINGAETKIIFEDKEDIEFIEFSILEYEGENPGLCEIEVFYEIEEEEIQYIKLYDDNENETFMYKYTLIDKDYIDLAVYTYPKIDISNNINISIIKGEDIAKIEDDILIIDSNVKSGKVVIRAELIDNPDIFDEIEVIVPNVFEKVYIESIEKIERLFDRALASIKYRLGIE